MERRERRTVLYLDMSITAISNRSDSNFQGREFLETCLNWFKGFNLEPHSYF